MSDNLGDGTWARDVLDPVVVQVELQETPHIIEPVRHFLEPVLGDIEHPEPFERLERLWEEGEALTRYVKLPQVFNPHVLRGEAK